MIQKPLEWKETGKIPTLEEIETLIMETLSNMQTKHLAYSGGIDSTLLLYYLKEIRSEVCTYTIASSTNHPDMIHALSVVNELDNVYPNFYIPDPKVININKCEEDYPGDEALRLFYNWVSNFASEIISGDGIDEYNCGYYPHMNNPNEETYREYLGKLVPEHLIPLDKYSGNVCVYLPYITTPLINIWERIPLMDKIDNQNRKKIVTLLAERVGVPEHIINRRKYGFCSSLENIGEISHEKIKC